MPRPFHCRMITSMPKTLRMLPEGSDSMNQAQAPEVPVTLDCLEAMRLADILGMGMDEGARNMGISRHTFGRILRRGRRQVARAIWEGGILLVQDGECALTNENQGETIMSEATIVAVPSEAPGGLDAAPSAHFGHCAAYTVATVENGEIKDVRVQPNQGHEHGGCVQPVQELAREGVKALLAGGMGMRPLSAMAEAGINVYYSSGFATVKDALEAFAAGKLQAFGSDKLCKGCGGHHH